MYAFSEELEDFEELIESIEEDRTIPEATKQDTLQKLIHVYDHQTGAYYETDFCCTRSSHSSAL